MHRKQPSVPILWLALHGYLKGRSLDFGCGHGLDAEMFDTDRYDPHWHPALPEGPYDTIICTYVLNVVSPETQEQILAQIKSLLAPTGRAFVTVRRDLPREGRQGRGCWQRYVELEQDPIREIGGYAIYEISPAPLARQVRPCQTLHQEPARA